jgi:hypothetical protein
LSPPADPTECVERLLRAFRTYDRAVDVVSAFEMVYTDSRSELPGTVRHFERFARIPVASGNPLTPDFAVLFNDGGGMVGEIARLSLREESVDDLCAQLARYDELRQLPDGSGLADVTYVDVILLVPLDVGPAAVRRVIVERALNDEHPYSPGTLPCVVQFGFDEGRYIFQRLPDPRNGMPRDGDRPDGLAGWFTRNGDFRAQPKRFASFKAARAFMNDPMDALYLATHLWAKTFPTGAGAAGAGHPVRVAVRPADLATELRAQHGGVRTGDVERALGLLATAKLAELTPDGWVVAWEELRSPGEHDLAQTLARRACRPPARGPIARLEAAAQAAATAPEPPPSLF